MAKIVRKCQCATFFNEPGERSQW